MLIVTTVLLGVLSIALAAYGGILASDKVRHRVWFAVLGILGAALTGVQGYYLHVEGERNSGQISQLSTQVATLLNTIKLQATIDDFRNVEHAITNGFSRLESAVKGRKVAPVQTAQKKESLPPPVVQHVRYTERRTASPRPDAKYGIQVIIQTDVAIQPTAFKITCDQDIAEAHFFLAGVGIYMGVTDRIPEDRKSYLFGFQMPAFTPETSLVATLFSKEDIRVLDVQQLHR